MSEDCVFCKIVKGEIASQKEYEDDEVLAFHDINKSTPVHVLVIPKKHIAKLADAEDMDSAVLGKCQTVAAQVAKKLGVGEAFRVLLANGKGAGQSVFHIHYHVVGGWKEGSIEENDENTLN